MGALWDELLWDLDLSLLPLTVCCLSLSSPLCLLLPPVPGDPLPVLTGNAPGGQRGVCHLLPPQGVPLPRDHWGSAECPPAQVLFQGGGRWGNLQEGPVLQALGRAVWSPPWQSGPGVWLLPRGGGHSKLGTSSGERDVSREKGEILWLDTITWSQTSGFTACALVVGRQSSLGTPSSHRGHACCPACHTAEHAPSWAATSTGTLSHGTSPHRAGKALTCLIPHPTSSNSASLHTFPGPQDIYESFDTRQRRASSPGYIDSPTYSRQGMSPTIPRSPHHFYRSGEDFSCNPRLG